MKHANPAFSQDKFSICILWLCNESEDLGRFFMCVHVKHFIHPTILRLVPQLNSISHRSFCVTGENSKDTNTLCQVNGAQRTTTPTAHTHHSKLLLKPENGAHTQPHRATQVTAAHTVEHSNTALLKIIME